MLVRIAGRGRVANKVALVTGAARGIGKAIADILLKEGATVFLSDIDAAEGGKTASHIGAAGFMAHDVTRPDQWLHHIATIRESAGALDILINNAAIALAPGTNELEQVTPESWNRVVEVNGLGTLLGCQAALTAMRGHGGSIVNISSVAAMTPAPTIAAYGFSKAGVAHLTRSVAAAGAPLGIRCNAVFPGIIRTGMVRELEAYHSASATAAGDRAREAIRSAIPMGGYQTGEDVALGVLYLASDEARYVTGAQLVIDGGLTL